MASSVSTQVHSTAHSATAAGEKTVTSYTGKVKSSIGKVKGKFQEGLAGTKGEMTDHEAQVKGGTQQYPGQASSKISQGQAKVNAEASKEPKKPGGLWGAIVSAAKWVAEKLKAAFQFVAKLLTDPGFWVSLIVAVALTAFVIATFGSGLAVLVVAGAIIGAISAGAGQVVTNLAEGKKWNEGLGTAMLVGGITGLIPGAGKALGTVGSKIAGKFGASIAESAVGRMSSKIASSALGKGVQALSRGVTKIGGKLGELGSKALKSPLGKLVSAPIRGAEALGTRAGTAVRGGLEDRFPGMFGGKTASEAADDVAKNAAQKVREVEEPPPLQDRIDNVTGVKKGPEHERLQQELKDFYENQQREAAQPSRMSPPTARTRASTRTACRTATTASPANFETREFAYEGEKLTQVTMRVHLEPQPGVTAEDIARVRQDALDAVEKYYNTGQHLPNGNRLNLNVEFTDDPAAAHLHINLHPGAGDANQFKWFVDSNPTTHAHELGHGLGFYDEYYDPTAINRGLPGAPGIHTDDSLMGDFWLRPPGGGPAVVDPATGIPIARPGTSLKDRHFQQLGGDIDNAAVRGGTHGPGTPGPGPRDHAAPMPGEGGAEDTAREVDVDLKQVVPARGSQRLLKMPGAKEPALKEAEMAEKLAAERGDDFVFPPNPDQPAIDGFWRSSGRPVQLKKLQSGPAKQAQNMVKNANEALDNAVKAGWTDIELHIEAPGITKQEASVRWHQTNRVPELRDMSGGNITSVTVHCSDGPIELPTVVERPPAAHPVEEADE